MKTIKIFDTTLRDGEQSPGCSMNKEEKIEMAEQLERLGVDIMEAGFAIASPGDFEAINEIAKRIKHSTVCSLARAMAEDIERAAEAIAPAPHRRIHTFIATSALHMEHKLKMKPTQVIEKAVQAVALAKRFTDDVEFSAEDSGRSDLDFLCQIFAEVIAAGATTINIPDTVGYTLPHEFAARIQHIIKHTKGIEKVTVSTHCHNDLGLAVANSLAGVLVGAGQVECTINGIGERAGNAALEEVVMAIHTRPDIFKDLQTRINTKEISRSSRLLTAITGVHVQPNKAIVGANAFLHEAGIHQHGMLSHKKTYEIMNPEDVGIAAENLVLGKHSGRHAFVARIEKLGLDLKPGDVDKAFERFKGIADKKKVVSDEDIISLISDEVFARMEHEIYKLGHIEAVSKSGSAPRAKVSVQTPDGMKTVELEGAGIVDAVYKAIDELTGWPVELVDYNVQSVTKGTDAMGEVVVRVKDKDRLYTGRGSSTDVVESSAKAYINGINKALNARSILKPTHSI